MNFSCAWAVLIAGVGRAGRDDAAGAVLSEEQRLRTLQDFDAGDVEIAHAPDRGTRDLHAVDVERHGLIAERVRVSRRNAAQRKRAALDGTAALADQESRDLAGQGIGTVDRGPRKVAGAQRRDGNRHLDQRLAALARLDDDFGVVDNGRVGLRLGSSLLIPVIRATGDLAKMLGYPAGLRWRRAHRNEPSIQWRQELDNGRRYG